MKFYTVRCDAIIVNQMLQGTDGIALVEVIRAKPEFAALKIILMTANTAPADDRHAILQKVDGWLCKLVKMDALFKALGSMFGISDLKSEEDNAINQMVAAKILDLDQIIGSVIFECWFVFTCQSCGDLHFSFSRVKCQDCGH